jgi:hypothetical protein
VIRGGRIPIEAVLRELGAGMTANAIRADHPRLTENDLCAAEASRILSAGRISEAWSATRATSDIAPSANSALRNDAFATSAR